MGAGWLKGMDMNLRTPPRTMESNHPNPPPPPLPTDVVPMEAPPVPLGPLDAQHAHVLRVVHQRAGEALVLQDRSDVVPVVLGHAPADGQVVCVAWVGDRQTDNYTRVWVGMR